MGKNQPTVLETRVQPMGWEDPLEKGTATHPSILGWRIPMDRRAWWAASPWGRIELETTEQLGTAQRVFYTPTYI